MNQQERVLSIWGLRPQPPLLLGGGGGGGLCSHISQMLSQKNVSAILGSFDNMTIVHTYISGWGLQGLPMDS